VHTQKWVKIIMRVHTARRKGHIQRHTYTRQTCMDMQNVNVQTCFARSLEANSSDSANSIINLWATGFSMSVCLMSKRYQILRPKNMRFVLQYALISISWRTSMHRIQARTCRIDLMRLSVRIQGPASDYFFSVRIPISHSLCRFLIKGLCHSSW
jgi:hypothetical protein